MLTDSHAFFKHFIKYNNITTALCYPNLVLSHWGPTLNASATRKLVFQSIYEQGNVSLAFLS